jgi:hypothetical protein
MPALGGMVASSFPLRTGSASGVKGLFCDVETGRKFHHGAARLIFLFSFEHMGG